MTNSKKKGNRMELEVVHLLRNLTGLKDWQRVGVSSGARATGGIQDPRFQGDIFLDVDKDNEDPQYKILSNYFKTIVIETKTTAQRITPETLLSEKSFFRKWIIQTERESNGKNWVLFFRYLASPVFACSDKEDVLDKLGLWGGNHISLAIQNRIYFVVPILLNTLSTFSPHAREQEGAEPPKIGDSV